MIATHKVSDTAVEHCKKYPLCAGCPFPPCVAPVGDHRFNEWVKQKDEAIQKLYEVNDDA